MNFVDAFKDHGRGTPESGGHHRLLSVLMVAEIALSVVLLISAGLLVRSFDELVHSELGIRPENVLALDVSLSGDRYKEDKQRCDFYERLLGRIESVPGVTAAGAVSSVPISGLRNSSVNFEIVDHPAFPEGHEPLARHRVASPGYFNAIGTSLRAGRLFTVDDDAAATRVALINEAMVPRIFSGENPIGQRLRFGAEEDGEVEIIGVVADVKNDDLQEQADSTIYVPYAQAPLLTMSVIVHTNSDLTELAAAVRGQVSAIDRTVPTSNTKTLSQVLNERLSPRRLMTWSIGIFAAVALLLAFVGIFAMTSYAVTQRTHEFGVRLALGAQKGDVLMLVMRQGLKLTLMGVVIGLGGAVGLTRALSFFLFGVTATDPLTFAGVSLMLSVAAILGCCVPARRAMKVDPMTALRYD